MSYTNVGKVWSVASFKDYLNTLNPPAFAKSVTLHHCAAPSLAQRPKGFLAQHIVNMQEFYKEKGWKSGPHLYTDEDQVWGMSPLTEKGVHAVSFNSNSIGIEVLGDYDSEDPFTGRGLECWLVTAQVTKALLEWLRLPVNENTIHFHRDDPTTSKTCPGRKIKKDWVIGLINGHVPAPVVVEHREINYYPVIDYVVDNRGYSEKEATKLLSKKNGLFFFGDDWLEGAKYDSARGVTVCDVKELQAIKSK